MTRLRLIVSIAVAAGLSACATSYGPPPPPPVAGPPPEAQFRAEDFAWSQIPGRAAIRGSVAYQGAGGVYSCAGTQVALIPDTPYSRGRLYRLYGVIEAAAVPIADVRARQKGRAGEAYQSFVRTERCDGQGRFTFLQLPAGGWFLIAQARPAQGKGDAMVLLRRVQTRPNRPLDIVLQ